ncbi:hypothetical protein CORC01_13541 [Colletotrichum orchidophilum]|uniref:Uncharacterized protein n=1 Tax=Colletotrichum orchidophilum TaxID=1209926 RepID=A0A1G4APZ7_9PEZI|nr:uncharacterized protein CORC01_13541 [Colletotrichum orchidophilum]OHE91165.1 hypothetical protein CORC01_13541 [Colletotrichum orchidophilum]
MPHPSQLIFPPPPGTDPALLYFGGYPEITYRSQLEPFDFTSDSDDELEPLLGNSVIMAYGDQQGAAAGGATAGQGTVQNRMCPNMRTCWAFSWEAYNLKTSDKAVLLRRICMIIILGIRTAISIFGVVNDIIHTQIVSLIIDIILGVLSFFFIAWALAVIGQAEGRRKVLGVMIGRWHLDIFLLVTAFLHAGILVGAILGFGSAGRHATWLIMWLLIFLVAWVATWPAEAESYV